MPRQGRIRSLHSLNVEQVLPSETTTAHKFRVRPTVPKVHTKDAFTKGFSFSLAMQPHSVTNVMALPYSQPDHGVSICLHKALHSILTV